MFNKDGKSCMQQMGKSWSAGIDGEKIKMQSYQLSMLIHNYIFYI